MTLTLIGINRSLEQNQGQSHRRHLGASIIGRECARQIWYTFHWFTETRHKGRMLRLFDRGNREEASIVKMLRESGIVVQDVDPETNEQFRVSDHDGHFGGSLDARMCFVPDWPDTQEWLLGEFKTHNDKSFKELQKKGLKKSKPEHYAQMQVYMFKREMPAGIYIAVNKNDDEMYIELVVADYTFGHQLVTRAGYIIAAEEPPPRISENPSWYGCTFCDHKRVCFFGAKPDHNCRSCVNSRPSAGGSWHCFLYNIPLDEQHQRLGCASHTPY